MGFSRAELEAYRDRQPDSLGGAVLWVVPNPGGLNAHETPATLAARWTSWAALA